MTPISMRPTPLRRALFAVVALVSLLGTLPVVRAQQAEAVIAVPMPPPPPPSSIGGASSDEERLAQIRSERALGQNAILLAAEKMLVHRIQAQTGESVGSGLDQDDSWRWSGVESALRREVTGGLSASSSGLGSDLDLLTGTRAIDESLQLGSIGEERDADPDVLLLSNVRSNLESIQSRTGTYPATLEEVTPADGDAYEYMTQVFYNGQMRTIASLAEKFTYTTDGETFTLELKDTGTTSLITELKGVEVPSHPWEEMLDGRTPERPASASLVPRDMLYVHLGSRTTYRALKDALTSVGGPLSSIVDISDPFAFEDRIAQRLGLTNVDALLELVDDLSFVSEDFDFFPNTDYALILKLRGSADAAVKLLGPTDDGRRGFVGEFYVVASSTQLFDRITATADDEASSLDAALDFHYALTQLEPRRDGIIYLSDDFIRKLVSPMYRLNAARRNRVVREIEALQQSIFAFRVLTGRWPLTLDEMQTEKYIDLAAVRDASVYTIGPDGVLAHAEWGTIWNVSPVSRVPITTISIAEKHRYEAFVDGYESFWREFFDPIGVAITVGDQIKLHTIILPLIDNSAYNGVRDVTGGAPASFEFVTRADRSAAMLFVSRFSIDGVFTMIAREEGSSFGAPSSAPPPDGSRARQEMEDDFREMTGWKEPGPIFDVVGDEVEFGIGPKMPFDVSNIADVDVWLGLKLTNPEKAQKIITAAYASIAKEMGSSNEFGGMFQISRKEPLKNTYNGHEFYMVPTGFVNIFYAFVGDRLYVTISQVAMNELLDGAGKQHPVGTNIARLLDYLGPSHTILALADLSSLDAWWKGMSEEGMGGYAGQRLLRQDIAMLREARTLAATFATDDGGLAAVSRYYPHLPTQWLGAELKVAKKEISVVTPKRTVAASDINLESYRSYDETRATTSPSVEVSDLVEELDLAARMQPAWEALRDLGFGLSFTEDGLSVQLAFNRPGAKEMDARFAVGDMRTTEDVLGAKPRTTSTLSDALARVLRTSWVRTAAVVLLFLIVLLAGLIILRRKPHVVETPPSTPPSDPPTPPAG